MVQTLIKKKKTKERVKADIIFLIDISDSMAPCIEGIEQNVSEFVNKIRNNPDISIDWRLGLLGHQYIYKDIDVFYYYKQDFSNKIDGFLHELAHLKREIGWDEANLPMLDFCLDNFTYRIDAHKFIIMFTDESINKGWNPRLCRSKINRLMKKIAKLGISLYIVSYVGHEFRDYRKLCSIDKCMYFPVRGSKGFKNVEFKQLMEKLVKSISTSSKGNIKKQSKVDRNIFNLRFIDYKKEKKGIDNP
jgi:uncharacterized protein YegL